MEAIAFKICDATMIYMGKFGAYGIIAIAAILIFKWYRKRWKPDK